jgi:hypothetical protein
MANLVYYQIERAEFKEAFNKALSYEEAEIIYKKLCKHFKLREVRLDWTSGCIRPKCSNWRVLLNYDNNNFGVLCHEVGHLWQFQKLNEHDSWHNKKHKKIMKRMIHYCEKRNWFEEELKRRTSPKPIKPAPTKQEKQTKILTLLEERKAKYERKIRLAENKIKKLSKQISALNKLIQK